MTKAALGRFALVPVPFAKVTHARCRCEPPVSKQTPRFRAVNVVKGKSLQDARLVVPNDVIGLVSIGPPFAFSQVQSILAGDYRK